MFSKRLSPPDDSSVFENTFKPIYRLDGKLVSAEYLNQRRLCNEALAGNRAAITLLWSYAQAQEEARRQNKEYDFTDRAEPNRERRATTAMQLLSIASAALAAGEVKLEPWVIQVAMSRQGTPELSDTDHKRIAGFVRDRASPEPAVFRLPVPEQSQRRSSEATQFKKGKSGNPKGRPKKRKIDLPHSGYFEEVGLVTIAGKERRMTRLQFVLHMLDRKGFHGNASMVVTLGRKYMQQKQREFKERQKEERRRDKPAPWAHKYDESRISGNGSVNPTWQARPTLASSRGCRANLELCRLAHSAASTPRLR